MPFEASPVKPACVVVLTPGIVVPMLSSAEFVAAEQHGHAPRDQQCQKKILDLAFSYSLDSGIRRLAFNPVVVAEVIGGPVMIVLSVGLIVLVSDSSPGRSE